MYTLCVCARVHACMYVCVCGGGGGLMSTPPRGSPGQRL